MKIDIDYTLNLIQDFESWRENYNGNKYGYGLDEYCKNIKNNYPEAYAKFGNGYISLYKITKNKNWIDKAEECATWLLENSYPDFNNYSWGLPFKFKCIPAFSSFLITTVFCCDFLLEFHSLTGNSKYMSTVIDSSRWIINKLYRKAGTEHYFSYSPYNCLDYNIYNACSLANGLFSKLPEIDYKEITNRIAKNIILKQKNNGLWKYSDFNKTIDCLHTAYTLEGLKEYLIRNTDDKIIRKSFDNGLTVFKRKFILNNGFCIKRLPVLDNSVKYFWKDLAKNMILLAKQFLGIYNLTESARLWGYAAALRLLSKNDDIDIATKIFNGAVKNLYNEYGFFNFKINNPAIFIRHQAHMFESIGCFIEMLLRTENNSLFKKR